MRHQRLAQRLPAAARLDGCDHVGPVDGDDCGQAGHVDHHIRVRLRHIAARIGQAGTANAQLDAVPFGAGHQRLDIFQVGGADHRRDDVSAADENVPRLGRAPCHIRDDGPFRQGLPKIGEKVRDAHDRAALRNWSIGAVRVVAFGFVGRGPATVARACAIR